MPHGDKRPSIYTAWQGLCLSRLVQAQYLSRLVQAQYLSRLVQAQCVSRLARPVFTPLGGPSVYPAWRGQCLSRLAVPVFIANQLIFSYEIYANLSAFAQYSGKICMKD